MELVSRFEGARGVSSIQSALSLLGELLVGSAEQVTAEVRGSVYRAVLVLVKQHAVYLLANDCSLVLELVQRGVSDKDRSSRLLAGCVLFEYWQRVY